MPNIDYIALGQRIRQARKDKNITQEKLGEICGLSTAHIGHIERGSRIPSLDTLFRISTELDVSVDWLLLDSVKNPKNIFTAISRELDGKNEAKVKTFLTTVKALADKIDEL
ncbi:MAG: helix-turn-helix transcriptional regulator [Clostridia bacterium]|nr:helix-turn-helix transcriptional regulator [Clostridia bacterium]